MLNIGSNYNYYDSNNDILEMLSLLFKKTKLNNTEVSKMCSLAQGIAYEAKQEGIIETKVSIIINMIQNNIATKDDAFKYAEADDEVKEKVNQILKSKKTS